MKRAFWILPAGFALTLGTAYGYGVSHHGGPLLSCEPPLFFDEHPPRDSKVTSFQEFGVTASDNTEASTIKVWINNQPADISITEERSGRLRVTGSLEEPVTRGKAWMRVTADSKDGCDQLFVWNVYIQ